MTAPTNTGSAAPQGEGGASGPVSRHCAADDCDRAAIRTREGKRYCLYHPTATPPAIDLVTGELRNKDKQTPLRPSVQRPKPTLRTPAPAVQRERRPRATDFDVAEAARRYEAGETLPGLAADLHVGNKRLRDALVDHGVQIRNRGEVIGNRGPAPAPIDEDHAVALYVGGQTTGQVARTLGVKTTRIQQLMRARGVLRHPGSRPPGPEALRSVRLRLEPTEAAAVRQQALDRRLTINDYLRQLVLADLHRDVGAA